MWFVSMSRRKARRAGVMPFAESRPWTRIFSANVEAVSANVIG